jgi:hypothetical protein
MNLNQTNIFSSKPHAAYGLWCHVVLYMVTNALEKHILSIFRVEDRDMFLQNIGNYLTTWCHNPDHNWHLHCYGKGKGNVISLHAMEALGEKGDIVPTLS